jgi:anti-sigma regulatory factor (Ser/Thr protein kinase)
VADDRYGRRFPAVAGAVRELCEFAVEKAVALGLPREGRDRLRLAVEEAAVNVCHHAFGQAEGELDLSVFDKGEFILVELSDDGPGFDPLSVPKPDVAQSIREGKAGGLGIHLMRRMADAVDYRREAGRNVLTLAFRIVGRKDDDPG